MKKLLTKMLAVICVITGCFSSTTMTAFAAEATNQEPAWVIYAEPVEEEIPHHAPYLIQINKKACVVTVYNQDATGAFTVPVKSMVCSTGKSNNTPLGTYTTSTYIPWGAMFGNVWAQYAIRFKGSFLFHSVPYLKARSDTLEYEEYNKLGTNASLGCVRLACEDIKWLYDNCPKGTQVTVISSDDVGPLGKPDPIKIHPLSPFKDWDPTDPHEANPWKGKMQTFDGLRDILVIEGSNPANIDWLHKVTSTDFDGKNLPVTVDISNANLDLVGNYYVSYSSTGAAGATITKRVKLIVVDDEVWYEKFGVEPTNSKKSPFYRRNQK